jgi:hypothetical protein
VLARCSSVRALGADSRAQSTLGCPVILELGKGRCLRAQQLLLSRQRIAASSLADERKGDCESLQVALRRCSSQIVAIAPEAREPDHQTPRGLGMTRFETPVAQRLQ